MKRLNILPFAVLVFSLSGLAFADYESEIRDLKLQKEKLNSEIQNLNTRIASTDSMLRADASHRQLLEQRYKADVERRNLEIDSLNAKIRKVASSLQQERNKQARAKNKSDNVAAKRRALRSELAKICKQLEVQIAQTLPWERDKRLDRAKSLTREIESGNVTEEEAFSRMKSLVNEEIKFGDEVSVVNSPLTRKNGEIVNAIILRIGNQWMVYVDENGASYGRLERKLENDKIVYEWNEELNLEERAAVKLAIDVKQAKKPPQIVKLPVSLSVVGGVR
jgi:predicted  nucleic acid-binding Zn-ribbon protein